ncbi:MAG: hypothetical protein JW969_13645 [Spirochaetales bacterium]|nr:hypothetical protein [Spirochaetales bacterium]
MNQDQVKTRLLSLKKDVPDFKVIFSGKNSKKVDGLYHQDSREIIIHNKNFKDDNELMYTAIHEFAHHVQFTTSAVPISNRCHTTLFWSIFHSLLDKAEGKGIYTNIFIVNKEFQALTRTIRTDFLAKNGTLMKEFGRLLVEAKNLCDKYNASFYDYLDRVLNFPRSGAQTIMKTFTYNINPEIGYENMKTVANIRDKDRRLEIQDRFLAGKSPDTIKMELKNEKEPQDPISSLVKEKLALESRIEGLKARLSEVEKRIKNMKGKTRT